MTCWCLKYEQVLIVGKFQNDTLETISSIKNLDSRLELLGMRFLMLVWIFNERYNNLTFNLVASAVSVKFAQEI
jgi:hypothetical protein